MLEGLRKRARVWRGQLVPGPPPLLHPGTFLLVRGVFITPEQIKQFRRQ